MKQLLISEYLHKNKEEFNKERKISTNNNRFVYILNLLFKFNSGFQSFLISLGLLMNVILGVSTCFFLIFTSIMLNYYYVQIKGKEERKIWNDYNSIQNVFIQEDDVEYIFYQKHVSIIFIISYVVLYIFTNSILKYYDQVKQFSFQKLIFKYLFFLKLNRSLNENANEFNSVKNKIEKIKSLNDLKYLYFKDSLTDEEVSEKIKDMSFNITIGVKTGKLLFYYSVIISSFCKIGWYYDWKLLLFSLSVTSFSIILMVVYNYFYTRSENQDNIQFSLLFSFTKNIFYNQDEIINDFDFNFLENVFNNSSIESDISKSDEYPQLQLNPNNEVLKPNQDISLLEIQTKSELNLNSDNSVLLKNLNDNEFKDVNLYDLAKNESNHNNEIDLNEDNLKSKSNLSNKNNRSNSVQNSDYLVAKHSKAFIGFSFSVIIILQALTILALVIYCNFIMNRDYNLREEQRSEKLSDFFLVGDFASVIINQIWLLYSLYILFYNNIKIFEIIDVEGHQFFELIHNICKFYDSNRTCLMTCPNKELLIPKIEFKNVFKKDEKNLESLKISEYSKVFLAGNKTSKIISNLLLKKTLIDNVKNESSNCDISREISINDYKIRDIDISHLRTLVSVFSLEEKIYPNLSVRDNILMGRAEDILKIISLAQINNSKLEINPQNVSDMHLEKFCSNKREILENQKKYKNFTIDDYIEEKCRETEIWNFIESQENKLDTKLNDDLKEIHKALILLTRSILLDPSILIIDKPSSFKDRMINKYDSKIEKEEFEKSIEILDKNIEQICSKKTVFIIDDDIKFLESKSQKLQCERIIFFDEYSICYDGKCDDLMKLNNEVSNNTNFSKSINKAIEIRENIKNASMIRNQLINNSINCISIEIQSGKSEEFNDLVKSIKKSITKENVLNQINLTSGKYLY